MSTETLKGEGKSSVEIYHHGAHITSWKDSSGCEKIYTSPDAVLDGSKAIRGGIPICFPQFGKKGDLSQHGFARNLPWKVDHNFEVPSGSTAIRFILEHTEETLASAWPFRFHVTYTITLSDGGDVLTIEMDVVNKDSCSFPFTMALHSYFVCDPESTSLPDFNNVEFVDSNDHSAEGPKKQNGPVKFDGEIDRIYIGTQDLLTIPSVGLKLRKTNLPEAVVWNPHVEKSAAMSDLPDDGWKHFICVEPARVIEPVNLEPEKVWSCKLQLVSEGNH